MMSQFGGKVPPPWQTRQQQTSVPLQTSLLGQHPGSGVGIPNPQIIIGTAPPQAPQYSSIQQSIIQPPSMGGLQNMHSIPQSSICPTSLAQPGQATMVQASLQGGTSLMGQPPINTQSIQTSNLTSQGQLTSSQIQQIQPQVTTVAYPSPRSLGPPGSFNSQGVPVNVGSNLAAALSSLSATGIITGGPLNGSSVPTIGATGPPQPTQKQRVFTGTITKLCADFGFVDEDVFFQTSCVKGHAPKVGDRVLVEASYNPNMPFKWNANRVQVILGQINASSSSNNRSSGPRDSSRNVSFNAVPPPNFSSDTQSSGAFNNRSAVGQRQRSPRRDRRDDLKRGLRDRQDRDDKDKDIKRESRKRSRSRDRTRSPPRRRARIVPRYNVQVPKIMLHMKEANVLELRKRYSNLYVPSDVFLTRPLWSDTFPAHRSFQFPRPVSFHIMNKDVEPVIENNAVYDPPDISHTFSAKVMLLAVPSLDDIYRRSCALSEDPSDVRSCFVHPTRLINFLVGLKGKNETMAIGGYWSPSLDGPNPEADPNVLIRTAIRTCMALTGIDLSGCTTWYRFAEIYYRRGESSHKGRSVPARVETTVLFLPDVWNICPTKLEWDGLQLSYKHQLDLKLQTSAGVQSQQQMQPTSDQDDQEEEDGDEKESMKKDPTHFASLDPKTMKVLDLRSELDARSLNSKGLKSQLIARLTKVLKSEQDKEDQQKCLSEKDVEMDESRRKEDDDRRKEEEKLKKDEEEKKKDHEESRKAEERERGLLEKRYTLPEQPMVIVHPSPTAKAGKFDCTTMSLSVLLDYRQEDNKEHSFEVSLFAELFNEMLMRDFAFRIYKALVEAPDKKDEKKESKEQEKEKKEDNKEDKDEKIDKKEMDHEKDKEKNERMEEKEELKDDKTGETKNKEAEEDYEEMEDEFEEEVEDDCKDKEKEPKEKEKRKEDKKENSDANREKKDKKKRITVDPYLLLSFVYFDQTHTGYIVDKDLEDITNLLGLNLSRAQLKKFVSKVLSRDVLYYRKLTDVSIEDRNRETKASGIDYELLAKGNNYLVPVFSDGTSSPPEKSNKKVSKNAAIKDDTLVTSAGLIRYEGSMVDISKLMQQLERSEKARNGTEDKLQELQRELNYVKEEARKSSDKCSRLSKEVKIGHVNFKSTEEELKKALEDNSVYQRALSKIRHVVVPLCTGVDADEEESMAIKKEEIKVKNEMTKNGISE